MKTLPLTLAALLVASPVLAQSADVTLTEITPPFTRARGAVFGAAMAFDGSQLVVGSNGRYDVYAWDGTSATPNATVLPVASEDHTDYGFGAVAVQGAEMMIGAPHDDGNLGAIYTYARQADGSWTRIARFHDPTIVCCDGGILGAWVQLDGDRAIATAPYVAGGFGGFYLMRRDAAGHFSTTPGSYTRFVTPVGSLMGFTATLVGADILVGNLGWSEAGPHDSGAVTLFTDTGTGIATGLTIPNPTPATFDQFGVTSVLEGGFVYAGARYDDTSGSDAGSLYVFDTTGHLLQTLAGPEPLARFSNSFDVEGDWLVASAPAYVLAGSSESPRVGSALIFHRDASGVWQQRARVTMPGGEAGTNFGDGLHVTGHTATVAAAASIVGGATDAGRAWMMTFAEPDGLYCAADADCTHGHCVGGICCNTACSGACDACGSGTCVASECDAGPPADGGVDAALDDGGVDGGPSPIDAHVGSPDATTLPDANADGGATPRTPLSCTCRASTRASSRGVLLLLSLFVMVWRVRNAHRRT